MNREDELEVLERENWEYWHEIKRLEYRLSRIAADTAIPQWVRDYAGGKVKTLAAGKTDGSL